MRVAATVVYYVRDIGPHFVDASPTSSRNSSLAGDAYSKIHSVSRDAVNAPRLQAVGSTRSQAQVRIYTFGKGDDMSQSVATRKLQAKRESVVETICHSYVKSVIFF